MPLMEHPAKASKLCVKRDNKALPCHNKNARYKEYSAIPATGILYGDIGCHDSNDQSFLMMWDTTPQTVKLLSSATFNSG